MHEVGQQWKRKDNKIHQRWVKKKETKENKIYERRVKKKKRDKRSPNFTRKAQKCNKRLMYKENRVEPKPKGWNE